MLRHLLRPLAIDMNGHPAPSAGSAAAVAHALAAGLHAASPEVAGFLALEHAQQQQLLQQQQLAAEHPTAAAASAVSSAAGKPAAAASPHRAPRGSGHDAPPPLTCSSTVHFIDEYAAAFEAQSLFFDVIDRVRKINAGQSAHTSTSQSLREPRVQAAAVASDWLSPFVCLWRGCLSTQFLRMRCSCQLLG